MVVIAQYGVKSGLFWLFTMIILSWAIHFLMLLFNQKYADNVGGILGIFAVFIFTAISAFSGWLNPGQWVTPFFNASLHGPIPLIIGVILAVSLYLVDFNYYRRHAYLQELEKSRWRHFSGTDIAPFRKLGLAGAAANLEFKLILRHKKSRPSLIISVLFLAYGLIFYTQNNIGLNEGIPAMAVFIGIFITGIFIISYGRLFLSWNSPHFDFFLAQNHGIEALVRGKYLLFTTIALIAWILTIPYAYFGWNILLVHTAAFLFNIGINIHMIIYMSLWKPKPMDLGKGAMFNYEGMGAAQFLIAIPMIVLPYIIYLPPAYLVSDMAGLTALGAAGIIGIIFYDKLIVLHVKRIIGRKYAISSSFRQEA
jgi:hypothetical protein